MTTECVFTASGETSVLAFFANENSTVDLNASDIQSQTSIKAGSLTWAGGGTSHAFTITGLTSSSIVLPIANSTANTKAITSYTVTTNTLTVTFAADPGATVIQYIAFISPQ